MRKRGPSKRRVGYAKEYYAANRERLLEKQRAWNAANKEHAYVKRRKWSADHPERTLFCMTKSRAKKEGTPFDITLDDIVIPDVCPVLGLIMKKGSGKRTDESPSIDRVDNSRGYVKGNVCIISFKANRLKGDARAEELRKIADYMERHGQDL